MASALTLRRMGSQDLPFADSLRAVAGWNQTPEDWQRFLTMEPEGCFFAEWDGTPAATATTVAYGGELAWIGMVLVHPDYRRRGIARALLCRCIEHLQNRGVRSIKLDATPAGQPVYTALGFKAEWTLTRWECRSRALPPSSADTQMRAWRDGDDEKVELLDAGAFGVSRRHLVRSLAAGCRHALVSESEKGDVAGYGLLRNGARALYMGPVSARSAAVGLGLIEALLACSSGQPVYWDVPDPNKAAAVWAGQHGFTAQRTLTRMWLGDNHLPGNPEHQFALAGPELG